MTTPRPHPSPTGASTRRNAPSSARTSATLRRAPRQGLIGVLEGANDPSFLAVLEEAIARLRHLWRTENADTFLIPRLGRDGARSGSAERAATGRNGRRRQQRLLRRTAGGCGRALRCPRDPRRGAAGEAVSQAALREALSGQPTRLLATLHGEGSTGVQQPLAGLAELAHAHGALLLVDSRWTISAVNCPLDELGIDIGVAGSQKAISAYPGLGLISFSERAAAVMPRASSPSAAPHWIWRNCAASAKTNAPPRPCPRRSSTPSPSCSS